MWGVRCVQRATKLDICQVSSAVVWLCGGSLHTQAAAGAGSLAVTAADPCFPQVIPVFTLSASR